jgi:serine/threonine protein kinase
MNLTKWNTFLTEDIDEQPTRKDEYDTADVIVPKGVDSIEKILSEKADRFKIIKKIGEGKFGVVYEAEFKELKSKTRLCAIKVIIGAEPGAITREINNYQFVKDNYQNFGLRRKYFPKVYETQKGTYSFEPTEGNQNPPTFEYGFIIMEILEPIDPRIKTDLMATGGVTLGPGGRYDFKKIDFTERDKRLFSNYKTIEKMIKMTLEGSQLLSNLMRNDISNFVENVSERAAYRFYNKMYGNLPEEYSKAFNILVPEEEGGPPTKKPVISKNWYKSITGKQGQMLFTLILIEVEKYIFPKGEQPKILYMNDSLKMTCYNQLYEMFKKVYVKPIIPGSFTGKFGREIMSPQPDSALDDFPESQNIIKFLNDMKQIGFSGFDLHSDNVMVRPDDKELVVVDLGLFKLEDIAKVEDSGDTTPFNIFEKRNI